MQVHSAFTPLLEHCGWQQHHLRPATCFHVRLSPVFQVQIQFESQVGSEGRSGPGAWLSGLTFLRWALPVARSPGAWFAYHLAFSYGQKSATRLGINPDARKVSACNIHPTLWKNMFVKVNTINNS